MQNRLMDASASSAEEEKESSLRPSSLDEYIGQQALKDNLRVFVQAARSRQEALDHVLFYGPPGLGKTTLAYILAREMGGQLRMASGPAIDKSGDLAAILSTIEPGDVLFIDEIHRLPRQVEEILYPAMEDYCLDIVVGKDAGVHTIRLSLPPLLWWAPPPEPGICPHRFGTGSALSVSWSITGCRSWNGSWSARPG